MSRIMDWLFGPPDQVSRLPVMGRRQVVSPPLPEPFVSIGDAVRTVIAPVGSGAALVRVLLSEARLALGDWHKRPARLAEAHRLADRAGEAIAALPLAEQDPHRWNLTRLRAQLAEADEEARYYAHLWAA